MGTDGGLGRPLALLAGASIALSALGLAGIAYVSGREEILMVLGPVLIAYATVVALGSAVLVAYTSVKKKSGRAG